MDPISIQNELTLENPRIDQSPDTFCYLARCFEAEDKYSQIGCFLFIKLLQCLDPPTYDADLWLDRWGPQFEKATYKNRQRLYLSEQASASASTYCFSSFKML